MDVRVHEVVKVDVETSFHNGDYQFVTRRINIKDKNGNYYSLTMFGATEDDIIFKEFTENHYD